MRIALGAILLVAGLAVWAVVAVILAFVVMLQISGFEGDGPVQWGAVLGFLGLPVLVGTLLLALGCSVIFGRDTELT